jgi:hypothetical protein
LPGENAQTFDEITIYDNASIRIDSDSGIDPSYLTLTEDQWFRNLGPSDPFRASKNSLDFSLQLANGLVAFNASKQAFNATGVAPHTQALMHFDRGDEPEQRARNAEAAAKAGEEDVDDDN